MMTRAAPLLFSLLIAGVIWLSWRHYQNARALLRDWADANGLRILHAKSNTFWLSVPLSMWLPSSQPVARKHSAEGLT
jgi:hypothetical protein